MGSSFPVAGLMLSDGADPLSLVALRFTFAAVMALFLLRLLPSEPLAGVNLSVVVAVGIFQTFGVMAPVHMALETVPPPVVAAILFSHILLVAVVDILGGRRRLSWPLAWALFLGGLGLLLSTDALGALNGQASDEILKGEFLCVLAATSWALATVISKAANSHVSWQFNAMQMTVGAGALLTLAALMRGSDLWLPQTGPQVLGLLWLAVPAGVVSFGLWFSALRLRSASEASAWLAGVPAFAAVFAWGLMGTVLGTLQLLGMGLIAVALILQSHAGGYPGQTT